MSHRVGVTQYRRCCRAWQLLVGFHALTGSVVAQAPAPGDSVAIELYDVVTGRPLTHAFIEVQATVPVVCRRAPCPPRPVTWRGTSDRRGVVVVPAVITLFDTRVETQDGWADLTREARPVGSRWTVARARPDPAKP